ncbi:MAG: DUF4397 domain-containing protein [Anaerolineae bacterium]
MTELSRFVTKAMILALMFVLSVTTIIAQENAQIRFVHVIPDTVPIDVYVNGTLTARNLEYGEASNYITVPAGDHTVVATAAGLSSALWQQGVSLAGSSQTTFIASNLAAPQFDAFSDNLSSATFGTSRLAIVHALANGPAVNVQLAEPVELGGAEQAAGTLIAPEVAYGAKFGEFDLPAQTYVVDVVPVGASDALLSNVELALTSNTSHIAVVYGTADRPRALLLTASTVPDDDAGFTRFVHGIVDGPIVDVLVNNTLIAPGLTPDRPTEHIALPVGEHEVSFVLAGTDESVGSTDLVLDASSAQTVAAVVVDGEIALNVYTDNISDVDEQTAVVSVLNTIDGASVTVTLSDGTILGSADAGEQAEAVTLSPINAEIAFTITIDDNQGVIEGDPYVFYGGVYHNIIVLDGSVFGAPSLLFAPTALAQTLASAPGSENTLAVTGDPAPPDTTQPESEVQPTSAPVISQPVAPSEDVILGEVALDPSSNLNLRQFPSADALVLGQAPSGASLTILGREGMPVALVDGQDPPPEAETYVDPVLDLGEGQDLDPTQTWVRVIYNTPDGGEIEAWTLSQYLIIRDDEGLVDLRDLEPTPNNVPGETRNTDVTPPPPPEDVVTVEVINLNANAGLNIRRTPDVASEVLGQLSLGTVVELEGLLVSGTSSEDDSETPEQPLSLFDADWAFISFAPAEGGLITGWVSTGFIQYQRNGQDVDLEELVERGLVEEVTDELIGQISAGTRPVTASTPDPQVDAYVAEVALDPGANLNLRRTPSTQAEVIASIPSGTFLIVEARTPDGEWLQTSFEGEIGWVGSQFVILTFNGAFVDDVFEVPVDPTITDTTTDEDDSNDN